MGPAEQLPVVGHDMRQPQFEIGEVDDDDEDDNFNVSDRIDAEGALEMAKYREEVEREWRHGASNSAINQ